MSVYGTTQIYIHLILGTIDQTQLEARTLESRGFEVLSVTSAGLPDDCEGYLITSRASRSLYVNFSIYPATAGAQHYQSGPYDGDHLANAALRSLNGGQPEAVNAFVTAVRNHERTFIPTKEAE